MDFSKKQVDLTIIKANFPKDQGLWGKNNPYIDIVYNDDKTLKSAV